MVICTAYSVLGYNEMYVLYDTNSGQTLRLDRFEIMNRMRQGQLQVHNIKVSDNKIVGNGIDIKRLYYDGIDKHTVIGEVFDNNKKLLGYDTVSSFGNKLYVSKENAIDIAKYGKSTNLAYVEQGNYVRVIDKTGIKSRIQSKQRDDLDKYKYMDTFWDLDTKTAIKIFMANGFKIGYTKEYKYTQVYGEDYSEDMHMKYYIMHDKNNNILYLNESLQGDNKLSYFGGHLVTLSLNTNTNASRGSSGVDKSAYTGQEYRYNTFDIREGIMKQYKEILETQVPLEYMLDNNRGFVYELNLHTDDIANFRKQLAEKYFPDDDLAAFGFENFVFMVKEYNNFSPELQRIFSIIHENIWNMFISEVIKDVSDFCFDTLKINKTKYKKMMLLVNELFRHYNIDIVDDFEEKLKQTAMKMKADREERAKKQKEEQERSRKNMQSSTGIGQLFGMFKH